MLYTNPHVFMFYQQFMAIATFKRLHAEGLISDDAFQRAETSLLIFLGYLQFEYDVFGDHSGSATFIPMVILFITAYYFDHPGVLSLAITNLGAWAGIAITPLSILRDGNFSDGHLIFTGVLLGVVLLAAGLVGVGVLVERITTS